MQVMQLTNGVCVCLHALRQPNDRSNKTHNINMFYSAGNKD
jgi:hypothetical protein